MKIKLPLSLGRNRPITPKRLEQIKAQLKRFLQRHPPEETTLVIDGPGVACLGVNLPPILLGYETLTRFKEIHTFSAGSYTILWLKAFHEKLRDPSVQMKDFYSWNQRQHGIHVPLFSLAAKWLKQKLTAGSTSLFRSENTYRANAAHHPFGDALKDWTASVFPENWHIWSYDLQQKEFANLGDRSEFGSMSVSSLIESTTAIPGIYGAHNWQSRALVDCVFAPSFKSFARGILTKSRPLIFCNMSRDKETEDTLYLKAHDSGTAKQRVNGDIFRFFGGLPHKEYVQNMLCLEKLAQSTPMELD